MNISLFAVTFPIVLAVYAYALRRGFRKGFRLGAHRTASVALGYVGTAQAHDSPVQYGSLKQALDGVILP